MKEVIKKVLKSLPIAFTQNQRYDRQTTAIIQRVCRADSNCIDVGCHKGEVLDIMRKAASQGQHFGFEPIPDLYRNLATKYQGTNCTIVERALSNETGTASFNYVVSNPSYSGLKKRQYDRANEVDQLLTVKTEKLDLFLPADLRVDLIKIDVEGGELLVLEGAVETLKKYHPVVIFEHGLGASEYYNATPTKVYDLLTAAGLKVSLMNKWLRGGAPLSKMEFETQFFKKWNYYFIAHP
jgi:FkbM family methyltransferase